MPSLLLFLRTWTMIVLVLAEEADGTENAHIKVSVSEESLQHVPSCIPGLSWIELVNTVSTLVT